jgi:hypothetical protein
MKICNGGGVEWNHDELQTLWALHLIPSAQLNKNEDYGIGGAISTRAVHHRCV